MSLFKCLFQSLQISSKFGARRISTKVCGIKLQIDGTPAARGLRSFSTNTEEQQDSSQSENPETDREYETKTRILNSALTFVNEYGWTKKAIVAGAEEEGYPAVTHGLFPGGGADLVSYFYVLSNNQLSEKLHKETQKDAEEKKGTTKLIRWALETRLRMIIPYIDTWPQAMGIMTLPQNAPTAWQNLANLVDEIWYHAGDRSTDMNWYTKRLSVAAVYKSSEIYMLQDKSGDYLETWQFMDRRIQDITKMGKAVKECQQGSDVMREGVMAATEIAKNILGVSSRHR
ncbi:unnamed protein product [Owenia fusiformis]|uniref:Ubiquinone biosynthesis protein n=1 Tax=Owenia fusiformis TaxID=6347 RepID=A0A8S4NCL0_OWEFU|nr:unnamed protein product [Owenia fusiformis]